MAGEPVTNLFLLLFSTLSWGQVQYSMLLPPRHLETVPKLLQTAYETASGSVEFTSGESYTGKGGHVVNNVRFLKQKDFDVWLMEQKSAGTHEKNHIAIVVEKGFKTYTSYYFEFEIAQGKVQPVPFTAACFRCHASGPRAIRPQKSPWTVDLNEKQIATIRDWNDTISAYGVVETFWPKYDPADNESPIKINSATAEEPFPNLKCVKCHSENGRRAPLQRQHMDSILYLLSHGDDASQIYSVPNKENPHMPSGTGSWSGVDQKNIEAWLKNN
jgi:hypothetical protein